VLWGLVGLISLLPVFNAVLISKGISSTQLWLVVIVLPFYILFKWYSGILRGVGKIGLFNIASFVGVLVQFVLVEVFVLLGSINLFFVLLSFVFSNVAAAIVVFVLVCRLTPIRLSLDWSLVKTMLGYGMKAYLWNTAEFFDNQSTIILIAVLVSTTELGYYSVAANVSGKLLFIAEAAATVLFPYVSTAIHQEKTGNVTSAVCRYVFFLMSMAGLCIGVYADPLVRLMFGTEFMPAVQPLQVLLVAVIIASFSRLITVDFAGRGNPEMGAFSSVISLIVSVVLIIGLTKSYGIVGVAFATLGGYVARTVVMVILFSNKHHIPAWHMVVPRKTDWHNVKSMASKLRLM